MLVVAIVLLGGATAAAIVLTRHEGNSSETVTVPASESASETGEFDESEYEEEPEEVEYEEEEPGEEFEEEEEEPSPAEAAQGQVEDALSAHFHRLANGNYSGAFYDLTASERESAGGESSWVEAQEEDGLQSFSLSVETSLFDPHSAQATIVDFQTHALATGCNDWSGYWEMSKVYGEWEISEAQLEKEPC